MSETVINRPAKIKAHNTLKGKGLTIERIYTTEGVHPYDQVKWERRDVVQQNWRTGETVFEQRGVEYPDSWSVNASKSKVLELKNNDLKMNDKDFSVNY